MGTDGKHITGSTPDQDTIFVIMHIPFFKDFYPEHNLDTTTGLVNRCIDESCHIVNEIEYASTDIWRRKLFYNLFIIFL